MKRILILLVIALMTVTMIACSSSKENPDASTSPKVTESAAPTKSPELAISPAPTDSAMASTAATPTASSAVSATPAPTDASKATVTPATTDSSKASATPVPKDSPKSTTTSTPAATQPEPSQQPEISPKGKKVLFVGREQVPVPAEDVVMADRLKGMGFIVTRLGDKDFTADETKGYDLLYFSQTVNSKFLKGGVMKDVAIPTVYVKSHGMF
ncbi:hypothetical protein AB4Z22_26325, partial [Paenibacillus sp. TAF58]